MIRATRLLAIAAKFCMQNSTSCSKRAYKPGSRASLRTTLDSRARRARAPSHNCADPSAVRPEWVCDIISVWRSNSDRAFPRNQIAPLSLTTSRRQFSNPLSTAPLLSFLPTYTRSKRRIRQIGRERRTFNQLRIKVFHDSAIGGLQKYMRIYTRSIQVQRAYICTCMHMHTYAYES